MSGNLVRRATRRLIDPTIPRSELDDYTKPFMYSRPPAEAGYESQSYYGQFPSEMLKTHFLRNHERWAIPERYDQDPFPFRRPSQDPMIPRRHHAIPYANIGFRPTITPHAPIPVGPVNFFSQDVNRLWKYLGPFTTAHVSRDKLSNIGLLRGERYRFFYNYRYNRMGFVRGSYPGIVRPKFKSFFLYSKLLDMQLFVLTTRDVEAHIARVGGIDNYLLHTPDSEELSLIHPHYRMWLRAAMKMYDKAIKGLAVSQSLTDRLWAQRRARLEAHYAPAMPAKQTKWSDPAEWADMSDKLYREPSRFHEVSDPTVIRDLWRVGPDDIWREQPWAWARANGRLCPLPQTDRSEARSTRAHYRSFKDHSPSGFPGLVAM